MLPVHCYCCLLWLKLWLRLKLKLRLRLWLRLKLHSAQKQGFCMDAPEGAVRGGGLFYEPRGRPTGLFPASPLAFASYTCSSLSCLSLCIFSRSRC